MLSKALVGGVVAAMALASGCSPGRKDVQVVNACAGPITVRVWDAPEPDLAPDTFYTDVKLSPVSQLTVKNAVTDVGDEGFSAEVLEGPAKGSVLRVGGDEDRVVIIPADLCASD